MDNATAQALRNLTSHRRALATHSNHHIDKNGNLCLGTRLAPLVLMLGCQRCGTNSLYEDIMLHVAGSRRGHALRGEPEHYAREQHFFATDSWSKGLHHYLEHFPPCPAHGGHDLHFTIDATPAYMRKPIVAARLSEVYPAPVLPKLRFMLVLRDPVDRLYAYWDTFVQSGVGVNSFEAWVHATMAKVVACQRKHGDQLWPPPEASGCDADTIEGVAAGLYAYQLIFWLHQFNPSQFFVTTLAAYERDSASVLGDAARFIGAPRALLGTPRAIGTPESTQSVKVLGAMAAEPRRTLGRFYHPHNAQLLHLFNSQPKVTYSPSLKGLEIQSWSS